VKKKRKATDKLNVSVKPPTNNREALEMALWLLVKARTREQMAKVAPMIKRLLAAMPESEINAAFETIDGRVDALERVAFGNVLDNLKQH